jgi:uncharacterized protein involved in exopolysaccharide biosynthesis
MIVKKKFTSDIDTETQVSDRREPPDHDDDEINLLDLFLVLLKHKWFIIGIVFISGLAAVSYSLSLDNIYRSEATIAPREEEKTGPNLGVLGGLGGMAEQFGFGGGGSLTKLEVLLKSRELTDRIINKYNLMPVLFPPGDLTPGDPTPTIQDGWKKMRENMLKVSSDKEKGTISIGIEMTDPMMAKQIVTYYIHELSELIRSQVLYDAEENIKFFHRQVEETSDALLKDKIYNLLAREIEKQTFARAQKYYSFNVLDAPIVPDLNKKVKPRRSIICILAVFVGFFMAVFMAFFREFVSRIKENDPERYQRLSDEFKFWKRRRSS